MKSRKVCSRKCNHYAFGRNVEFISRKLTIFLLPYRHTEDTNDSYSIMITQKCSCDYMKVQLTFAISEPIISGLVDRD